MTSQDSYYTVYFLRSLKRSDQTYIGYTDNLDRRLSEHNRGYSKHTNKFKPWKLEAYVFATDIHTAKMVETYYKSNAGKESIKRHIEKNPQENTIKTYFEEREQAKKFAKSKFYVSGKENNVTIFDKYDGFDLES
jgi:putative endonuclease